MSEDFDARLNRTSMKFRMHIVGWIIIAAVAYPMGVYWAANGIGNAIWAIFYLGLAILLFLAIPATLIVVYQYFAKKDTESYRSIALHLWLAFLGLYMSGVILGYAGVRWYQ